MDVFSFFWQFVHIVQIFLLAAKLDNSVSLQSSLNFIIHMEWKSFRQH